MRDPGCSWVHAKFRTLRYQRLFPPTNTLPCLTIFSLPPFTMVLSWQATFNSIKMVFQFLSMSLNLLLNRRGLPDTTTFFPQCNLLQFKSLSSCLGFYLSLYICKSIWRNRNWHEATVQHSFSFYPAASRRR
jgi:hypothetical protein